jgi:hypothetical protein
MDQREIQDNLFHLESEKEVLISTLDEINELLSLEGNSEEEIKDLNEEKDRIEFEIQDITLDIGMYTEMMDKLYPSEIGACGFPCDGCCQQCNGNESYEPMYEVFTSGDY